MGLVGIILGPLAALIGIGAVFFVLRHRSVQTKSMYSARRGQIERKVRAARQRTLAPGVKQLEKDDAAAAAAQQAFIAPGMEGKTAAPTATWGPTAVAPTQAPPPPAMEPMQPPQEPAWEVGPTVPSPPSTSAPSAPVSTPYEPVYPPPTPPGEVWTPAPAEPVRQEPAAQIEQTVSTPAGGGAAWSIVGEAKPVDVEADTGKKSKKKGKHSDAAPWQLASGVVPGDEDDEVKGPSSAVAVAQYAVLVVGLVMVLIGVLVMVANSHVT
jgi:hypothetical protein